MSTEKERVVSSFAEMIRVKRTETRMSLREVASLAGISHVHVRDIELGKKEPTLTIALRLCEILELNINDLFEAVKTPQP